MTHSDSRSLAVRSTSSAAASASRVYFIEAVGLDLIKIGYACDVAERMRKLRPGCPAPLRLLGTMPGGLQEERNFHFDLRAHQVYGEWFKRCPEIEKILLGIDAPSPLPKRPMRRSRRIILESHETAAEIAARL